MQQSSDRIVAAGSPLPRVSTRIADMHDPHLFIAPKFVIHLVRIPDNRELEDANFVRRRRHERNIRYGAPARLLGDLRFGAALRTERQIDIFEPTFAVCGEDGGLKCAVELALLTDGIKDDGAPVLQLAQIAQAVVEGELSG